jgi:hypothetical protein
VNTPTLTSRFVSIPMRSSDGLWATGEMMSVPLFWTPMNPRSRLGTYETRQRLGAWVPLARADGRRIIKS